MSRALLIAFLGLAAHYGAAQTTPNATCQAGFEWTFNSLGQSPCDVAAFLGGVCINGPFTLPSLGTGQEYFGPPVANANPCRCSSVYYSLLSACALCQNDEFIGWTLYKTNCTTVYSQVYPERIPPYTRVPHWAFLDVTVGDTFNPTLAESAGGPESSSPPAPTGGSQKPTAGGSKKSNTGAIAGGVVGGVLVIAIIAGCIFWLLRRKRQPAVIKTDIDPVYTSQNALNTPTTFPTTTPSPAPFRPYDPNDPSTYPSNTTSPAQTLYSNSNSQMTYNSYNYSQPVPQMVSTGPSHPGIPEV